MRLRVVDSISEGFNPCYFHVARTGLMISCMNMPFQLRSVPKIFLWTTCSLRALFVLLFVGSTPGVVRKVN